MDRTNLNLISWNFSIEDSLFYPLGLLNHVIHAIYPQQSNQDCEDHFSRLPFGYIGCCCIQNLVVLGYIVYFVYSHGRDATFYRLFLYESSSSKH